QQQETSTSNNPATTSPRAGATPRIPSPSTSTLSIARTPSAVGRRLPVALVQNSVTQRKTSDTLARLKQSSAVKNNPWKTGVLEGKSSPDNRPATSRIQSSRAPISPLALSTITAS